MYILYEATNKDEKLVIKTINFKNWKGARLGGMTLTPAFWRQKKEALGEFEVSLIYKGSSRLARVLQKDSISTSTPPVPCKRNQKEKKNRKEKKKRKEKDPGKFSVKAIA